MGLVVVTMKFIKDMQYLIALVFTSVSIVVAWVVGNEGFFRTVIGMVSLITVAELVLVSVVFLLIGRYKFSQVDVKFSHVQASINALAVDATKAEINRMYDAYSKLDRLSMLQFKHVSEVYDKMIQLGINSYYKTMVQELLSKKHGG